MRITIEIGSLKGFTQRGGGESGWPEPRRTKTIRVVKAIKTDKGHGKLVVRAYCAVYERKKPWKAGRPSLAENMRKRSLAIQMNNAPFVAGEAVN